MSVTWAALRGALLLVGSGFDLFKGEWSCLAPLGLGLGCGAWLCGKVVELSRAESGRRGARVALDPAQRLELIVAISRDGVALRAADLRIKFL